jgi:hypothetical protein
MAKQAARRVLCLAQTERKGFCGIAKLLTATRKQRRQKLATSIL